MMKIAYPNSRTSIQNGKLSIEDVSPKDEGVYVCEAQNTVGTISVSATLSVHGKFIKSKLYFYCTGSSIYIGPLVQLLKFSSPFQNLF